LGTIDGGRVLDVATAEGGFVGVLKSHLKGFTDVIGVDVAAGLLGTARASYAQEPVHFFQMDAERLAFADGAFDTVGIAFSLHHLRNVPLALNEMLRVLKPGGHMIIVEMHRDALTEAQLSGTRLHQWAADVDSALGLFHQRTLPRQKVLDYAAALDLWDVAYHDWAASGGDPLDGTIIQRIDALIDRQLQRVEGAAGGEALKGRGEALRQRLREVGFAREPVIVIVGTKDRGKGGGPREG
jgi:ubiquinone/menaquinone biosynthesis C-methylase UbiE